jgi:hypothetical protein
MIKTYCDCCKTEIKNRKGYEMFVRNMETLEQEKVWYNYCTLCYKTLFVERTPK